jgi:Holliday junction resolvasome RuvABC endonuclease subunit
MKHYVGLDLSYSATGLFIIDDCGKMVLEKEISSEPSQFVCDIQRCDWIANKILEYIKNYEIGGIVIEDYFSGGNNSGVGLRLAVLGSIVRLRLLEAKYSYLTVTNAQNKKFIAGNGHANKDQMQMFILKKYGIMSFSNNTADACGMAHIAKSYKEFLEGTATKETLIKYEFDVLKKISKESKITEPYTLEGIIPTKSKKKNDSMK